MLLVVRVCVCLCVLCVLGLCLCLCFFMCLCVSLCVCLCMCVCVVSSVVAGTILYTAKVDVPLLYPGNLLPFLTLFLLVYKLLLNADQCHCEILQ